MCDEVCRCHEMDLCRCPDKPLPKLYDLVQKCYNWEKYPRSVFLYNSEIFSFERGNRQFCIRTSLKLNSEHHLKVSKMFLNEGYRLIEDKTYKNEFYQTYLESPFEWDENY